MGKVIDITDRLSFDGNPSLKILDKVIEVNADAPTMLKIMSFMQDTEMPAEKMNDAYNLIFPEKSRKVIEGMKLSLSDWIEVVKAAIGLANGGDGTGEGEA